MAKSLTGKRPCKICHKWFQPDVRQKGRQETCGSPDCQAELHRRNCKKWNDKNKEYFKNNYLGSKIELIEQQEKEQKEKSDRKDTDHKKKYSGRKLNFGKPARLVLPYEIIKKEYGIKNLVILQYIIYQIINQIHGKGVGST